MESLFHVAGCPVRVMKAGRVGKKTKRPQPEGLRRYHERKRQEKVEHLQQLGLLPKSNYKSFSEEKKGSIREFKFLKLPFKIRREIYSYLFISTVNHRQPWTNKKMPSESGCLPVSWNPSRNAEQHFFGYSGGLSLVLLQTCMTIYKEGHQFIGRKNVMRFGSSSGYGAAEFCNRRKLPMFLKPQCITKVHMFFTIDATEYGQSLEIMWAYLLEGMTQLRELPTAIAWICCARHRTQRNNHHRLKSRSAVVKRPSLNGFMATAIMNTPKNVALKWGPWPALLKVDTRNRNRPDQFTRLLRNSLLERVAAQYAGLRGTAVKRKKKGDEEKELMDTSEDTE